jgi:DNA polymerase-1
LLIELFKNGEDIHSHTASELFGVPLSEVTSAQRRAAKIVNFGIVYGISDYTLAQNLHMRIADAKQYTDKYFERFPSIKPYLEKSITEARERGYSKTLMGRKRYIPELLSDNYSTRLFGERVAMNTPLQGTSADIIKLAMVEVSKRLKESKSYLVLQVHDELVIEAHESEIEQIKIILKESMENAMQLNVPLTVDISEGETLYEC